MLIFIFRFMVLFWVTTRISWHPVVLQLCIPALSEMLSFSSCLSLRPHPIPSPLWVVSSHTPEPVPLTTTKQLCWFYILCAKLTSKHELYNIMWQKCDVTESHHQRWDYWQDVSGAVFSLTFLTFKKVTHWRKRTKMKTDIVSPLDNILLLLTPAYLSSFASSYLADHQYFTFFHKLL